MGHAAKPSISGNGLLWENKVSREKKDNQAFAPPGRFFTSL
jgi:hypothetical protein